MEENNLKSVMNPQENDVLCGRGLSVYLHQGNKKFRSIVSSTKSIYNKSSHGFKATIARKIVLFIRNQEPSGRFIAQRKHTKDWYEISLDAAIQKTQQALREKNKWAKCDKRDSEVLLNIGSCSSESEILSLQSLSSDQIIRNSLSEVCPDNGENYFDSSDRLFSIDWSKKENLPELVMYPKHQLSLFHADMFSHVPKNLPNMDNIDKLIVDTFS